MPTITRSDNSPWSATLGQPYPNAYGDWYVVLLPTPTKITDKGVQMPDQTVDKLWYGIVLSSGPTCENLDGMAIYFNRSSVGSDAVPLLNEDGIPTGSRILCTVYKSTVQAVWPIKRGSEDAFLSPPATPPDYEWQREQQKRTEMR